MDTVTLNRDAMQELAAELLDAIRVRDSRINDVKARQFADLKEKMLESKEEVEAETKIDPSEIDWRAKQLSVRNLRQSVHRNYRGMYDGMRRGLREANAESSFGQLLRYGVQNYLFDAYQNIATVYPSLFESRPSSNRQEWYAPLYGAEIPEDVDAGGKFDDSRIRGLDVVVINKKVGRILSIERELVDDDQTGQIVQRSTRLGERMRYKEEIDAMLAFVNAQDYSTGVATTGFTTAIGNKGTNGPLSMANLEAASVALRKMKDPMGNFMLVQPDSVLAGPDNEIPLYKLLNSVYQPAIPGNPGAAETISTALSGQTGWTLTANWLQGRWTPIISTFLASAQVNQPGAWYVCQAKRGAIMQERDPLEAVQENPLAGTAFEFDAYRYRVRRRYRPAVIEVRFIYQGNGPQ